jgi:GNAT superfamily N-acetyltransferase
MPGLATLSGPLARRLPVLHRQRGPLAAHAGIRPRRPRDLGACVRLAGLARGHEVHRDTWRAWLTAPELREAWVMERMAEILGHVAVTSMSSDATSALRWREITEHPPSELAGVSRLFVRPRVRGQGIGAALLDTAVTSIRRAGRIPVVEAAGCGPDELNLYDRRGFRLAAMFRAGELPEGSITRFYVLPPTHP